MRQQSHDSVSRRRQSFVGRYLSSGRMENGQYFCFFIFLFLCVSAPLFFIERAKVADGAEGYWSIPHYDKLLVLDGTIEPPAISGNFKGGSEKIGQLRLDSGNIIGFSCTPSFDYSDVDCVYDLIDDHKMSIGQRVKMRFLVMPKLFYPSYKASYLNSEGVHNFIVPRMQKAIAMELMGVSAQIQKPYLSYQESVSRINDYMKRHPFPGLFDYVLLIAFFAIFIPIIIGLLRFLISIIRGS